jgi:cytochrome c5
MGEHDDKVFLKRFSGIIAGLVIVTILIIIISLGNDSEDPDANPSRAILAAERVAPIAGVRTEMPAPEAIVEAEAAPESTEADQAVAQETTEEPAGAIDAAGLYAAACSACHIAGVAGAPVPGTDLWNERAANGEDVLVTNAITGIPPMMMPKGGRADFSDEEIRAIVQYMMEL